MQIKHLLLTVFKVQDQNCLSSMLRPLLEHVLKQISNNRFQESHANLNAHMGIHSEFTKNHSPGLPFKVNRMAGGGRGRNCSGGQAIICTQVCTVPMSFEGKNLCVLICV